MGSGLRLPAPSFSCTRSGSFSRGDCFGGAAFGVTPHSVLTTRAFYTSAFVVSQLVLSSNGVPKCRTRKWSVLSSPARQDSTVKGSDGFMMLLSKIERSSEKTMEIMKNLSSLQALEGNRQLEDLLGVSLVPCSLKSEAKKTKELMTKVMKQKLFEKKNSRIPPKVLPSSLTTVSTYLDTSQP
nr:centromere protein R isoform X4 [Rattus norvegicus]|eukprot:XP_017448972.1 PREDICTED: centromere protein R isoform X3 [Rattus norvegicus]